ncbi:hypothetical protein B0H10DRAFT_1969716 [Mycena sp. CBHHK59/15]|nr:hypothetical protein B0H10DRAFT_1969716 [Mycena sp. CBHHK59/15]
MRINTTITSVMEVECLVHRGVGRKTMHRNQEEFHTNIHQALRGLCQSGIVGDAEMLLFYAFHEPETGDLKAGTRADLAESIHGHSTHNKNNFDGDELEQTYGVPWAKFADGVIPRPVVEVPGSISIIMTSDGVVIFPSIDLDTILPSSLRHLLQEYLSSVGKFQHIANSMGSGSQSTTPAQSALLGSPPTAPARSETLPPYQDVPPPGPESLPSRTSPWDDEIPIFGRNRVIYIRTVGLDVTPPDHFVELFPSISAELFA